MELVNEFALRKGATDTMKTSWLRCWPGILLGAGFLFASPLPEACAEELDDFIAIAMENSPLVRAARQDVAQSVALRDGVEGFFDPRLLAGAGKAERVRSPAGTLDSSYVQDAADVAFGGVETALSPGFYASAGAEERYFSGPDDGRQHLYQTVFGAQVRVPLWQDRGFYQVKQQAKQAGHDYQAAVMRLETVSQGVRRDVEQQYISALEAAANVGVARAATERVRRLLSEAMELVRLQTLPEYQLFSARSEVALRQEEQRNAESTRVTACRRLAQTIGQPERDIVLAETNNLIALADTVALPADDPLHEALARHPAYQDLQQQLLSVDAQVRRTADTRRADVSLRVGATWEGESPDHAEGDDIVLSDPHRGADVLLLWRRPLGYRSEDAALRALQARREQVAALIRQTELQVQTDLQVYREQFLSARERMRLVGEAVAEARKSLGAEEDRFRLGEGRSRNVLDSQNDLTKAIRSQNTVAAVLLTAHSNYRHAAGYGGTAKAQSSDMHLDRRDGK